MAGVRVSRFRVKVRFKIRFYHQRWGEVVFSVIGRLAVNLAYGLAASVVLYKGKYDFKAFQTVSMTERNFLLNNVYKKEEKQLEVVDQRGVFFSQLKFVSFKGMQCVTYTD